ncbi:uncharacterized protein N7479_002522 [Penicillium vulpinum]|uniref:uncharacterized protein n=1 Tax=Penicillium vulpinum TaxID=29845 RepID=UPI002548FC21|nr:uncharacterized protein N7479_002522 [Penicillium vulpinum]KAJ5972604.1 hypothetical protein N7479_002522 [Penicillium vulpinum]
MEEKKKRKKLEADVVAMPPIVTYHPHPPTYFIAGTCRKYHDMMMIMVGSEVMAMPGGFRASSSRTHVENGENLTFSVNKPCSI